MAVHDDRTVPHEAPDDRSVAPASAAEPPDADPIERAVDAVERVAEKIKGLLGSNR